jgi:L-2-hydroxyglutarate oxidase LhgO
VPHSRTCNIIAAADDDEAAALKELKGWAEVNGVHDLTWLDSGQLAHIEPEVRARCALFSPSTGVVDTHQLMSRLEALCTQNGASVVCRHEVTGIRPGSGTHTVDYRSPCGTGERLRCRWLINCAGLCADRIAACAGIDVRESGYRLFFCKGEYFSIPAGQARRIRHLIYPPPYRDLRGLGIHVTKCIDGTVKLGPNAFYVDDIDFTVNPGHAELFFESVCPYLPFLAREDLQPDMAGIRPKLQAPGEMIKDFVIRHEAGRGMEGIINLVGIESPGLTACLSIARMVADIICGEKS